MLSVLYVRFRDVAIIWIVFAQVLFYATPILYPIEQLRRPASYEHLLMINPLAVIFEQVRVWILNERTPVIQTGRSRNRADRRRSRRRRAPPAAGAGDLRRRLRLRRLDLQPRRAADRRGPLAGTSAAGGRRAPAVRPRRAGTRAGRRRRGGSAASVTEPPGAPSVTTGYSPTAKRRRLKPAFAAGRQFDPGQPGRERDLGRAPGRYGHAVGAARAGLVSAQLRSRSRAAAPARGRCRPGAGPARAPRPARPASRRASRIRRPLSGSCRRRRRPGSWCRRLRA